MLAAFNSRLQNSGSRVPVQNGRQHQKMRVLSLTVVEEVVLVGARQHCDDKIVGLDQADTAIDPKEVSLHTRGLVQTIDIF